MRKKIDILNKYLHDETLLMCDFNNKEEDAFTYIYKKFYHEIHLYALKLYHNSSENASDVVQNIFIHIWENKNLSFKNIISLKAYIIISVKNRFKNYLEHESYVDDYKSKISKIEHDFDIHIIESRLFSEANELFQLLPAQYLDILLLYIDGWKPEEIAEKLKLSKQTVYNRKNEAINLLKNKIYILFIFFR